MTLTPDQLDRALGAVLGSAVGDALGVPYEFRRPVLAGNEYAEMIGGGLGDYAPGEWSDDTSMAVPILEVVATGADLSSDDALDAVAAGFLRWYDDFGGDPPDIGNQTRAVLAATRHRLDTEPGGRPGVVMRAESLAFAEAHPRSAGNGALMRTTPVALAHLDDREDLARSARMIAELTHADVLAADSCVLWCEAIRVAILDGHIDIRAGVDLIDDNRRSRWRQWLDSLHSDDPKSFSPNGYTVTALQAAGSAIIGTTRDDPSHLPDALHAAIRIGDDTDTVAAIAGGLLGARWGAKAIPDEWRFAVHGWPLRAHGPTTAQDLTDLVHQQRRSAVRGIE